MRPRLLMNFTLRCVRFYPGVNSRAELVTLAPGRRWLGDYSISNKYNKIVETSAAHMIYFLIYIANFKSFLDTIFFQNFFKFGISINQIITKMFKKIKNEGNRRFFRVKYH